MLAYLLGHIDIPGIDSGVASKVQVAKNPVDVYAIALPVAWALDLNAAYPFPRLGFSPTKELLVPCATYLVRPQVIPLTQAGASTPVEEQEHPTWVLQDDVALESRAAMMHDVPSPDSESYSTRTCLLWRVGDG